MALTCAFTQTVGARARRDPSFATALLDEAATLFLNGEPDACASMSNILLFVRRTARIGTRTAPYMFLGSADYVSRECERPMPSCGACVARCRRISSGRRRWRLGD